MNDILCPIDFSDCSLNAMEYAARYAKAYSGRIHLLHVEISSLASFSEERKKTNLRKLEALHDELCKLIEGVPVDFSIVSDPDEASSGISNFVIGKDFDIIIMGTNGVSDVEEAFFGSNTSRLINSSQMPVIAVPSGVFFEPYKKIVYATEYHSEDKDYIQKLQSKFNSNTIIHVVNVTHHAGLVNKAGMELFKSEVLEVVDPKNMVFSLIQSSEAIDHALDKFITDQKADILVLLAKESNFLARIFERSVTKEMVYFAKFPILIFKAEE
jgi:nucleotide-binding universal stress UspA family protein